MENTYSKNMLTTETENFLQLLGGDMHYEVQRYQRDYSWEDDEWIELWEDILFACNHESNHYMGYIVLEKKDKNHYIVIDGQQRITTLSIMILSLVNVLKEMPQDDKREDRVNDILNKYIGKLDLISYTSTNKLVLNKNNNSFYKNYLSSFQKYQFNNLNSSCRKMSKCFDFFTNKLRHEFKSVESLLDFIDKINYFIIFTRMEVENEISAYTVFETLNARGVELSTSDLLKNYMFSIVDREDNEELMNELESLWNEIVINLNKKKIADFIFIYWNGKYELKTKKDLFKALKNVIKTSSDVFTFLRDLNLKAINYNDLIDYNSDVWKNKDDIIDNLKALQILNLDQPYSILVHAKDVLNNNDFEKLLKYIVVTSFRYNTICRKDPKVQANLYNSLSIKMINDGKFDFDSFIKNIYINDDEFESEFIYKTFNEKNNDIVKYLFKKIAVFNGNKTIDIDKISVEHILPKSVNHNWNIDKNTIEIYAYRIGNLMLLEPNINKKCDTLSFIEKKKMYKSSHVEEAKNLGNSDKDVWTVDDIVSRQKKLAKYASGYFRVN